MYMQECASVSLDACRDCTAEWSSSASATRRSTARRPQCDAVPAKCSSFSARDSPTSAPYPRRYGSREPARHRIGHFGDVSPSQYLGLVWKKTKPNTTKARIHQSKEMYYNSCAWNRLPAHVVNSDSVAVFKRKLACVNLVNFCS